MENILLVTTDSLRADHVGHHGYERDTTPFLDELAERGSVFHNAYAHTGGTRFAFPSILTSIYPMMHGGYKQVTDDQTVIAEVFSESGYQTGGFHSNLYLSSDFGYDRGWDEFYDSKPNPSSATKLRSWAKRAVSDTPLYPLASKAYDLLESKSGVNVGSYLVPADETTDMVLNYVAELGDDRPTFIWVHYMDPHHPFLPPEEYQRLFRDDVISNRESVKLRQKLLQEPENVTEEELQKQIDLYDAEIRFNDDEIRRLVTSVREQLGDVTVAFTSDHGEHFLEHGYFSGAQLHGVKQHVPLLIEGGNWDDDGDYDDLVAHVDIPTTLVRQAGLERPENFYGHEIQELVGEGEWERDDVIGGIGIDGEEKYAVRTPAWKYIWREESEDTLYDLEADSEEQHDVLDANPDVVADLQARLEEHQERVRRTEEDVDVEMDEEVKERLRRLGYKE
ncbi:MAG: arylsulfatase A-like enzyme [Natrialbaceae archaeon]|jgi:arylsulfatase A-like enzyme